MDVVDDLIVGAGSAGAALAGRLSEDPGRRVVLIEAGPHYPTDADTPGERYAVQLAAMAQAAGVRSERLLPKDDKKDWNDVLLARRVVA